MRAKSAVHHVEPGHMVTGEGKIVGVGAPENMPAGMSPPDKAADNGDGRLEVFGIGSDRSMYNMWQTHPHAGPWSGWNRLT